MLYYVCTRARYNICVRQCACVRAHVCIYALCVRVFLCMYMRARARSSDPYACIAADDHAQQGHEHEFPGQSQEQPWRGMSGSRCLFECVPG